MGYRSVFGCHFEANHNKDDSVVKTLSCLVFLRGIFIFKPLSKHFQLLGYFGKLFFLLSDE